MLREKVEIILENWTYECGEPGCCTDYGQNVFVDGQMLGGVSLDDNPIDALEAILRELGFEPTVRYMDDEEYPDMSEEEDDTIEEDEEL
jgi:hypothetical protein